MYKASSAARRRRRDLLALGFYGVAAVLLTAPVAWHSTTTVARAIRPDVWLNVWALAWTSEHLLTAPAGLFDANIFFPHLRTLAYTDHFIGEALVAAPVYLSSGSAVVAYNAAWFAALVLTGWGGYLWARSLLGDEPGGEAAALVAGAVCLFVPGKRTALSHLQVISLQGVTLSLFAAHLLIRRASFKRSVALAGAAVYAGLCSWYTAAYTSLALVLVLGAGLLIDTPREGRTRTAAWAGVAVLMAAAIMYPVSLPYREVQSAMEFERPVDELMATSLSPLDFVSSWSWAHREWMPQGSGAGGYFPGFVALALAALGLWDGWRRRHRWPLVYAGAAVVFAVLALGPRLVVAEGLTMPMPYELLFRWVPGVDALRNPYRAAFFASILLAAPIGYGARVLIAALRGRLLYRKRWQAHPRLATLSVTTWSLALAIATLHLLESWPGPQQIAALPRTGPAYQWLAAHDPGAAALVVPLPRPFDDNARYQLGTVGNWVPLVNGHSGLYPADFLELYEVDAVFPDPRFLRALKERFPVRYVIAHHGLDDGGEEARAAALDAGLPVAWAQGNDVIHRIGNGAEGGWARRRIPARLLGERMVVELDASASGCELHVSADGAPLFRAPVEQGPPGARRSAVVDLTGVERAPVPVVLELYLSRPGGLPRADLLAEILPGRVSRLTLNGVPLLEAPVVIGVLDGSAGRLSFTRTAAADDGSAAAALRSALQAASTGDELLVAVAEDIDYGLIERLRLLLGPAGGPARPAVLAELGTTYAFRGTMGAEQGSAREEVSDERSELTEPDRANDCRAAAILGFEMAPQRNTR